jgi:hypothetical protein
MVHSNHIQTVEHQDLTFLYILIILGLSKIHLKQTSNINFKLSDAVFVYNSENQTNTIQFDSVEQF